MESLYSSGLVAPPVTIAEYETLLISFLKGLDGANSMVRKSFSSLFAVILALSQKPPPVKGTVKVEVAILSNTILSITDMFSFLSRLYLYEIQSFGQSAKPMTRRVRIAIVQSFASLLKLLGVAFVEGNYSIISKSLLDFAAHPKHRISETDTLLVCEMVGFLLREVIGKVLSETGQLLAIKELSTWLKEWPPSGSSTQMSDISLICVLDEISALLYELGPVIFKPIFRLLILRKMTWSTPF
jgi:hypothetical protein